MLKFHGVTSLLTIMVIGGVGAFQIFQHSWMYGWAYVGLFGLVYTLIYTLYCAKCPADIHTCPHVLQGALKQFLPVHKTGDYTVFDKTIAGAGFLALALFPQYWLVKNPSRLMLFWVLVVAAVTQIGTCVCTGCCNHTCTFCRNPQAH